MFFLVGIGRFLLNYKHYLSMLLRLELIMLSLYGIFCIYLMCLNIYGEILILFLTIMVCEGVFGLCLLVSFSISYGRDMFYYLS